MRAPSGGAGRNRSARLSVQMALQLRPQRLRRGRHTNLQSSKHSIQPASTGEISACSASLAPIKIDDVFLQRRKEDRKELFTEFDAESGDSTDAALRKLDEEFASSTKHYGLESSLTPPPLPRPDEDGLDAPAVQRMMEQSRHTAPSQPGVHAAPAAPTSPHSPR